MTAPTRFPAATSNPRANKEHINVHLQNTTQNRDKSKTRREAGAMALSALITLAIAVLILHTGHRTTRPPTPSIARPAQPAALTPQASGLGNCLVNAHNHARACYQAAQAPTATPAPPGYFRDPTTHALLPVPAEGCDAAQLRIEKILRTAVEPGWIKEGPPRGAPPRRCMPATHEFQGEASHSSRSRQRTAPADHNHEAPA